MSRYRLLTSLRAICVLSMMAAAFIAAPLQNAHAQMSLINGAYHYHVPVTPMSERKFAGVVKQQYDFSCGSAALATLLTFHYNRPTTEMEALEAMYGVGNKEKIEKEGFSLLDMKKFLKSLTYQADGYQQELDKLRKVGVPAIALINYNGYMHFVVVKGVSSDSVLVGDPALGLRSIDREKFEAMWNGILFVVKDEIVTARSHFNQLSEWANVGQAPLSASTLHEQTLSSFTLNLKTTPNYY